jgi:hypothetical protein
LTATRPTEPTSLTRGERSARLGLSQKGGLPCLPRENRLERSKATHSRKGGRGRPRSLRRWAGKLDAMSSAAYALRTMADAADAVETGAGTVHERLFEAFTLLARIGPEDIPDGDLRAAFAELMAALTSESPKGTEGRLVATLKAIDEDQAQSIARAIVDLYHALGRLHER